MSRRRYLLSRSKYIKYDWVVETLSNESKFFMPYDSNSTNKEYKIVFPSGIVTRTNKNYIDLSSETGVKKIYARNVTLPLRVLSNPSEWTMSRNRQSLIDYYELTNEEINNLILRRYGAYYINNQNIPDITSLSLFINFNSIVFNDINLGHQKIDKIEINGGDSYYDNDVDINNLTSKNDEHTVLSMVNSRHDQLHINNSKIDFKPKNITFCYDFKSNLVNYKNPIDFSEFKTLISLILIEYNHPNLDLSSINDNQHSFSLNLINVQSNLILPQNNNNYLFIKLEDSGNPDEDFIFPNNLEFLILFGNCFNSVTLSNPLRLTNLHFGLGFNGYNKITNLNDCENLQELLIKDIHQLDIRAFSKLKVINLDISDNSPVEVLSNNSNELKRVYFKEKNAISDVNIISLLNLISKSTYDYLSFYYSDTSENNQDFDQETKDKVDLIRSEHSNWRINLRRGSVSY